jgi:L-arabinokinase
MGGVADYSGSLVLQWPLSAACHAGAQRVDEPLCIVETTLVEPGIDARVSVPLADLAGQSVTFHEVRALFAGMPSQAWGAYVLGSITILAHEFGLTPRHGVKVLVDSVVPLGAGLASSAALEVAAMQAICAVYGIELEGRALALLCQRLENLIVGAPCGVMDQMTSALGEEGKLLCLLCQPAELHPSLRLPDELEVWGITSGIRHAISGADYGSVRTGAFMGYRILADELGFETRRLADGKVAIDDSLWHGYLANVPVSRWDREYQHHIPVTMNGAQFLDRFDGITDSVTEVDRGQSYAIKQPAAHPVHEHHRVGLFQALLESGHVDDETCYQLGELMYASHASYSACGLGSEGTNRLVQLVHEAPPEAGLWGAKITGGGSGGTVAVLARRGKQAEVERIARQYASETGLSAAVLGGSSPGAVTSGVLPLAGANRGSISRSDLESPARLLS